MSSELSPQKPSANLALAIDVHGFLEAQVADESDERRQRDREVGKLLVGQSAVRQILGWWQAVGHAHQQSGPGARVMAVRRGISNCLIAFGFLLGAVAVSVALTYDGGYPINMLALIGVLVGLPGLLLLLTLLSFVLRKVRVGQFALVMARLNFNRWLMGVWDRLAHTSLASAYGQRNALGQLGYWQVVVFSQWLGVGFFAGVMLVFVVMVAFTDLAFGWSTTLQFEAASVHFWVGIISAPWASFVPSAVPDLSLIEASRYFRINPGSHMEQAARLGEWWPFALLTVCVWGLIPRLLVLSLGCWQVSRCVTDFLLEHSEVTLLLERLNTPLISPGYTDEEEASVSQSISPSAEVEAASSYAQLVIYNEAIPVDFAEARCAKVVSFRTWQIPPTREDILAMLDSTNVAVVVKGWEPPLLEFLDFLQAMRDQVGAKVNVYILPVALPGKQLNPSDQVVWRTSIATLGDPFIVVSPAQVLQA